MNDIASTLGYGVPMDTSVVVNRTTKLYHFLHDEYNPTDVATCTFPTGADYVDTRRSFLTFELNTVSGGVVKYGFGTHGSVCNTIKRVCVYARSGEELCRMEEFNLFSNMMLPFTYNRQWFQRQGNGMWYGSRIFNTKQTCVIPMYILSPLFNSNQLLPAALVSGMRVELTLEDHNKVTFAVNTTTNVPNTTTTIYSLSGMTFHLETVKLADGIQMAMDELMATKGVEMVYKGWHHAFTAPRHDMTNGVELSISESYARALSAFARVRPESHEVKAFNVHEDPERDSFRGEHIFPISDYQWRCGDRFYPDKPVTAKGGRIIIKSLMHTLNATNQLDGTRDQSYASLLGDYNMPDITSGLMSGNADAGTGETWPGFFPAFPGKTGSYARDGHIIGVDLTRDSDNGFSGRPVNNVDRFTLSLTGNNNSLEFTADSQETLLDGPPNRRLDLFLEYAKLVRIFTNNVQVEK